MAPTPIPDGYKSVRLCGLPPQEPPSLDLPTDIADALNLGCARSQANYQKHLGPISELYRRHGCPSPPEWRTIYEEQYDGEAKIEQAVQKILPRTAELAENIRRWLYGHPGDAFDAEAVREEARLQCRLWFERLVYLQTVSGLDSEEVILARFAEELDTIYEYADASQESRNVDGRLGCIEVSVKPLSRLRQTPHLPLTIDVPLFLYERRGSKMTVWVPESWDLEGVYEVSDRQGWREDVVRATLPDLPGDDQLALFTGAA